MAFALYVFRFAPDGTLVQIPLSRWDRIERDGAPCPECANQTVRFAYVCVELQQRRALAIRRIEGIVRSFDETGALILPQTPPAVSAATGLPQRGNVIDVTAILQQRRYWSAWRWEPSPQDISRLMAEIECVRGDP